MRVRCACGWESIGDEDAVVAATQEHGERLHNMTATREQILAMAIDDHADERPGDRDPPTGSGSG